MGKIFSRRKQKPREQSKNFTNTGLLYSYTSTKAGRARSGSQESVSTVGTLQSFYSIGGTRGTRRVRRVRCGIHLQCLGFNQKHTQI